MRFIRVTMIHAPAVTTQARGGEKPDAASQCAVCSGVRVRRDAF